MSEHRATLFNKDIELGIYEGEQVYLAAPSWDCGWYWGFGYIQNKNMHTHFDGLGKNNMFDNIKDTFKEFIIQDDNDLWKFCELMCTFYTLKATAEVLNRGGSHYCANTCKDIIQNTKEADRINNIVLPAIFDQIYLLLKK